MEKVKSIKIGLKTYDLYYKGKDKINFDTLELISSDKGLLFNSKKIARAKKFLENKNLSMHTQTTRIFGGKKLGLKNFEEIEIGVLKSEIILCKILGCKELIFHLKPENLTKKEEKILEEIISFGEKNGVETLYENIGHSGIIFLNTLKKIPKLKCVLDLGHLNIALGNKELGMPLEKFIDKIKERVVYIHAHNNHGHWDEHKTIDDGTLNWRYALDILDLSKVRKIIIEARTPKHILKTKKALEEYLKRKCQK